MRLFVALPPPPESLDEVQRAFLPYHHAWPGLRWLSRDNWHVTLAFLGEVPDRVLPRLEERLARAAARHAPMTFSFTGAGAFPSARRSRVVWSGLDGPRADLVKLAASLQAGARRAGAVETDDKRLRPHLSVARSREDVDVRPLVAALSSFTGAPWEASEIHLVRSDLGARVRYQTVESWPLSRTTLQGG
ncbi:RNA 2',3'-cyclic phosphodiesterase [Streptosporangium sp. KLBMP 9127]|nr:RNA 2',3'-cyclic phosphodiesterase [Streptosporangium sp. KLBMP 9127]